MERTKHLVLHCFSIRCMFDLLLWDFEVSFLLYEKSHKFILICWPYPFCFFGIMLSSITDAGTQTSWLEIQSCTWWTFSNNFSSLFRFPEDLDTLLTQNQFLIVSSQLGEFKTVYQNLSKKKSSVAEYLRESQQVFLKHYFQFIAC